MEIDVRVPAKILSLAECQAIEIAKALSIDARVLVMDEPTSIISSREVDRLEQTVRHMIGTEPGAFFPKEEAQIGESVLTVRGLSSAGFVENVSFEVRAGEILGFFGLVGAGRSEVAQMLFGITKPDRGEIRVEGQVVRPRSPRHAMQLGISFLPPDWR